MKLTLNKGLKTSTDQKKLTVRLRNHALEVCLNLVEIQLATLQYNRRRIRRILGIDDG